MTERRKAHNAYVNWGAVKADYDQGFTPRVCAAKENQRLALTTEQRRVSANMVRVYACNHLWKTKPHQESA